MNSDFNQSELPDDGLEINLGNHLDGKNDVSYDSQSDCHSDYSECESWVSDCSSDETVCELVIEEDQSTSNNKSNNLPDLGYTVCFKGYPISATGTCCNIHCPAPPKIYFPYPDLEMSGPKFLCDYCGIIKNNHRKLVRHLLSTHREKSFKCEECGKMYAVNRDLRFHMKHHHQTQEPVTCFECGKMFAYNTKLKVHQNSVHKKIRNFNCTICPSKFVKNDKLKHHMASMHNIGEKRFKCEKCSKSYTQRALFNYHMQSAHSENKRPFICQECGSSYTSKYTMLNHNRKVHKGEAHFCETCKRGFSRKNTLEDHKCKNPNLIIQGTIHKVTENDSWSKEYYEINGEEEDENNLPKIHPQVNQRATIIYL